MALFVETVKLEDKVSPAAKAAASEAKTLGSALDAVNKSLVKASALGDLKSIGKLTQQAGKLTTALGGLDQGLLKEVEAAKAADAATAKLAKSKADEAKAFAKAESDKAKAAKEGQASLAKQKADSDKLAKQGSDAVNADMASQGALLGELAAGFAVVAAAIAVVVVGLGALVVAGAKFAIASSEAKAASISLFSALGEGKITGEEVDDMLDDMRATTGLTKDSLGKLTTTFLKMGVTGKDALEGLTIAAASAEALAKGGGDAFASMIEKTEAAANAGEKLVIPFKKLTTQLSAVGLNAGDVAASMGITTEELTKGLEKGTIDAKKFGSAIEDAVTKKGVGPLQALANSSENLGKLLQEYLGDLFEDLGASIAPFMTEVKSLFSILDSKANPSGKALKAGIEGFFKNVFAIATKVVPLVKHFLLDLIIYGLKAYIALKPIGTAIKQWAESAEGAAFLSKAMGVLVEVFKGLAVVVGFVLVVAGLFVATIIGIQLAIVAVGYAILAFTTGAGEALYGWVAGAATAAGDFILGLVRGITAGAGQVIGAVTGLADSAIGAFTGVLGIKSPSTVMFTMGENTGEGAAQGIESKEADVHGASSGLADAAVKGASSGGQSASGGSPAKGGSAINVTVLIDGAGKAAMEITEEMVAMVFERAALAAGV